MPKKVKKRAGSKRQGWTEEDKLLHMQQKAQAEEELNKKKEETLRLFLKDKLQKEEQNTAINLLKLNDIWRTILRQTRQADLRDDITVMSQTFEMRLDSINNLIKCLVGDLEEAELWERQSRNSHLSHLQRLQGLQDRRLKDRLQQWERGLREVDFSLTKERESISAASEQQCARLEDVTFELQRQHKQMEAELQQMYNDVIAAYQCAHQERIAEIQEHYEHKQASVEVYESISFEQPERPSPSQEVSQGTESDVRKLQEAIAQLRKTLTAGERECELAEAQLRAAKGEVARKTRKLQADMTLSHRLARKQLTELTIHSSDAIKKLQGHIAQGERVLRSGKMCSKRENELEKMLPLFLHPLSATQQHHEELPEGQEMDELSVYPKVEQMLQRYNMCVLQREALRREKESLSRKNLQLQDLLRQHLDAMTVSEPHIHDQRGGSLLSVSRAPQKPDSVRAARPRVYRGVVEAVHVISYTQ